MDENTIKDIVETAELFRRVTASTPKSSMEYVRSFRYISTFGFNTGNEVWLRFRTPAADQYKEIKKMAEALGEEVTESEGGKTSKMFSFEHNDIDYNVVVPKQFEVKHDIVDETKYVGINAKKKTMVAEITADKAEEIEAEDMFEYLDDIYVADFKIPSSEISINFNCQLDENSYIIFAHKLH